MWAHPQYPLAAAGVQKPRARADGFGATAVTRHSRLKSMAFGAVLAVVGIAADSAVAIAAEGTQPGNLIPPFAAPASPAGKEPAGEPNAPPQFGPWGFDLTSIDANVRPGEGFYDYANGRWVARAVVPADKTHVGMYESLIDQTQDRLLAIVEEAARSGAAPDTSTGKIGALYRAYMDEARLEALDVAPIAAELDTIRAATSLADIATLMGRGLSGFGPSLFDVTVSPDEKDPGHYAVYISESGLGLADRDYYVTDAFKDQLAAYRNYAARLLDMIGWPDARRRADDLVAFETRIAEASWSRTESRDRTKTYNAMTPAELADAAPQFPWAAWLAAAKLDHVDRFVVRQTTAFPKLAKVFADTPLETLRAWEAFRLVDEAAEFLSRRFANAHFSFRTTALTGQSEERPRAKRAVDVVNEALGDAVGSEYVARYFPPKSKARMEELVGQVMVALKGRIERLSWMSAETKAKALEKLALTHAKIGYPETWRDYSALAIDATDLVGNIQRSDAFKWDFALGHLGKPVDPQEWTTSPQDVNALYDATRSAIVFPAAVLQPPFFDPNADMAINYGGIGAVIGHELTHGFDDQGRKTDGHGVLTDWWQPNDAAQFEAEAAKLIAQFDRYEVAPGLTVKGSQTIGENIADLGGVLLALDAYRASLAGKSSAVLSGFNGEQRVFLGWAQVWRSKYRPEALQQQVASDPHAPMRFRVDGPFRNVDAWYDAWGIKPGDTLYLKPEDRIRIW